MATPSIRWWRTRLSKPTPSLPPHNTRIPYNTYGPWRVKKLYLHLYPNDQITLDWSKPLQSMGGKTGFELAEEAFAYHVTQAKCGLDVTNTGVKYDNRVFRPVRHAGGSGRAR